jgi:hypothetical protein
MASMRIPAGAALGVAPLFALACTATTEPAVKVAAVVPAQGFNGSPVDVVIEGGPFRPAYDIDTFAGSAVTQLGAFSAVLSPTSGVGPRSAVAHLTWLDTATLGAEIPRGLPAGDYDVEVHDPRGNSGARVGAFRSLGLDEAPPEVTLAEPPAGSVINAGAEIPVAIAAEDAGGQIGALGWSVSRGADVIGFGTCPVDPGASRTTCRFVFFAPLATHSETVKIEVHATDDAGNKADFAAIVLVALPPVVAAFSPREGAAAGGTSLTVNGAGFVPGTRVLFDGVPLMPSGGLFVDAQTIRGRTPAHEPGVVPVVVRSGTVEVRAGTFEYVGRPVVLAVSPATAPLAGNVPVVIAGRNFRATSATDRTLIEFGPHEGGGRAPLGCVDVVSENRITGVLPAGAGFVSVFASDPVGGESELERAVTYLGDETADAGPTASPCLKVGAP